MKRIQVHPYELAPVAAALLLAVACPPAFSSDTVTRESAGANTQANGIERPRLVEGYRPALGLKPSQAGGAAFGGAGASPQLLVRQAHAADAFEPLFYSVERAPLGIGLRGPVQATGVVLRGGERWSSSFESSTSADLLTSSRRTALLGQLHAPLAGGAGVSLGLSYSHTQAPGYPGSDTPLGNGYHLAPGRSDSSQQLGYQLQLNYLYGERNTVALNYGTRRESEQYRLATDSIWPDGPQLSLSGEHWFSPSWALRYDIPASESVSTIRRQGLRLGVHYRF